MTVKPIPDRVTAVRAERNYRNIMPTINQIEKKEAAAHKKLLEACQPDKNYNHVCGKWVQAFTELLSTAQTNGDNINVLIERVKKRARLCKGSTEIALNAGLNPIYNKLQLVKQGQRTQLLIDILEEIT